MNVDSNPGADVDISFLFEDSNIQAQIVHIGNTPRVIITLKNGRSLMIGIESQRNYANAAGRIQEKFIVRKDYKIFYEEVLSEFRHVKIAI